MPLKPEQAIIYNDAYPKYGGSVEARTLVDWERRIDMAKMRKDKLAKFRQEMKESGIAVALVTERRNVRYTMAYQSATYHDGQGWGIVPLEGEPVLWAHGLGVQSRRNMDWIRPENIREGDFPLECGALPGMLADSRKRVAKEIKSELEDMKLAKEMLVLDRYFPAMQAELEKVGIKTRVDPNIGLNSMEIKTPEEIECFRILAAICDIVHWETAIYAGPGMTELDITGYFRYKAMQLGCEIEEGGFCMSGEHTMPNYRMSGDRLIRPGDIVYWDLWGIQYNGYRSCNYRTYSAGYKASQKAQDTIKEVNERHFNALAACKPGNTTADMVRASGAGRLHIHGLGHEAYVILPVNPGPNLEHPCELKEGQVFALSALGYHPDGTPFASIGGYGLGIDVEDMVLVTKTGAEVLTRSPSDVIITIPMRDEQGIVFRPPEDHLREAKARLKLPVKKVGKNQ